MYNELIDALRYCSDNEKQDGCDGCPYLHNGMCHTMLSDAACALERMTDEVALKDKDIEHLQTDLDKKNRIIKVLAKKVGQLINQTIQDKEKHNDAERTD